MVPRQHCRPSAAVLRESSLQDLPMVSDAPARSTRVGLAHWAGASALPAWPPTRAGHRPCRVLAPARCLVHNMGFIATLLAPMLIARTVCAARVVAAPAIAVHQRQLVAAYAVWLAIGRQLARFAVGWAGQTFLLGAENINAIAVCKGAGDRLLGKCGRHMRTECRGLAARRCVRQCRGAHHLAHVVADAHCSHASPQKTHFLAAVRKNPSKLQAKRCWQIAGGSTHRCQCTVKLPISV